MSITNKGSKWERKNSLYALLGFVPVLNCLAFFHMSSRVKNKKWSLLGWIVLIMNIVMLVVPVIAAEVNNPNDRPYYSSVKSPPEVVDYMTNEQKKLYYEDYSYEYSSDFKLTREYSNYKTAYDQWYEDSQKWEKRPEIVEQIEAYENFEGIQNGITMGLPAILCVLNLIFLIILLTERPKYLKLLAQSENISSVVNRIDSFRKNSLEETDKSKKTGVESNDIKQIDINSASEEELSALQGLTIVDAKKAISYREEHGGFNNADEFFTCINAKPHIIVNIQNSIIVGDYKTVKVEEKTTGKRKLDL